MTSVPATTGNSFPLLHRHIQEQLYRMQWRELRFIQNAAIQEVIQGSNHLIIAAPTAGGKTEAAFLPILSKIVEDHTDGVRVVYVGPLKALINDQFRRLEDLCKLSGIRVHKWHGDVSAAAKKELRQRPSGVLLITPESIESLFVNHNDRLEAMFSRLAFVVIDELHSFIGTERGAHLRSLLFRLVRKSKQRVRVLGLSATFGDDGVNLVGDWICLQGKEGVRWLTPPHGGKDLRYLIKGYFRAISELRKTSNLADDETEVTEEDHRLAEDLLRTFHGKTALIFANNKARLEFYADLLGRQCSRLKLPNWFRVHHGSLSKDEREDTEAALRSKIPTATFASSTLEMGIDVGNVKLVGQIGAPWSVNSLTQRLGRSGRGENEASELRMFIEEDELGPDASLIERLYPDLLQAVAMTDLLLEKWCEPPQTDRLHLSTLIQQILSVVTERGGAPADRLFDVLVEQGAFAHVDQPLFVEVLRSMGKADLLEQTPEGELILGLKGERIVRSKDFYVAFLTPEEFSVIHQGRSVGSIDILPGTDIDHYLILAGRRWKVVEVHPERKLIVVQPSRGGKLPKFRSSEGPDIHPHVREKMRQVLWSEEMPIYLDSKAQEMLAWARAAGREADLRHRAFVSSGPNLLWFTWTGTRINRTLLTYGRHVAKLDVADEGIALAFEGATENKVREAYRPLLTQPPSPETLAALVRYKTQEKYEPFLSDELQAHVFARNSLDLAGAHQLLTRSEQRNQ